MRVTAARKSNHGPLMSTPVAGMPHNTNILNPLRQQCEHSPQRAIMGGRVPPISKHTRFSEVLHGYETSSNNTANAYSLRDVTGW